MIGGLKYSRLAFLAALGMFAGGVASAQAADLGGDCCADLEERVAELEATAARKGNRKVSLEVSGFVNEAMMFWDDSVERNAYQTTNMVAQTRFRFVGKAKVSSTVSAGYLIEVGVNGARSDAVDAGSDDGTGPSALSIRHSAWWIQSSDLGKVWVGQTSQATDGITEINLANLGHFAGQNIAAQVGGFQPRVGGVAGNRLNTYFGGANAQSSAGTDSSQIGEGNRRNVVKYESPTIAGFIASASYGEDDIWDVALRYAGEFSGIKIAAGVGYEQTTEGALSGSSERNCRAGANGDAKCQQFGASGAIMHVATGLFVHGGYGMRTDDNASAALKDDSTRWFVQAGIEQNFFGIGKTTVFGEYQQWDVGHTAVVNSAKATAWGLGLNQSIDAAAMDLYISYHSVQDLEQTSLTGVTTTASDFQYLMAGGVIKF